MKTSRILSILGITTVLLAGVTKAGLTPTDVVLLYWIEGVVASILVGLLLWYHRAATHKRGHFMKYVTEVDDEGKTVTVEREGTHLPQYIGISVFFHVVFGVFFGAVVLMMVRERLDGEPWGLGNPDFVASLFWILLISLAELMMEASNIHSRSMRWMVFRSFEVSVRTILTALFVIFVFFTMVIPWTAVLLAVLIVAKGCVDLLLQSLAELREGHEPPWILRRLAALVTWDEETLRTIRTFGRELEEKLEEGEEVLSPAEVWRLTNEV